MPWALPLIALSPEVIFVGLLLVALAIGSTVVYKSAGQATGLSGILTAPLRAVVNAWHALVRATISRYAVAHLTPLVRWFASMNALVLGAALNYSEAMATLADAVERMTHNLRASVTYKDGTTVKTKAQTATKTAGQAKTAANTTSTSLHNYRVKTAPKITHATHAVDHVIPGQIGTINTEIDRFRTDQTKLKERTTSLENGAVDLWKWMRTHALSGQVGLFAGAVAVALARLGFGFLRCRNWQKLGRSLTCGMGAFLSELLAIGFAYTVVVDPVKIAHAADDAIDVMDSIIRRIAD